MASIFDIAKSSDPAALAQKTDFSTNYGFQVLANDLGLSISNALGFSHADIFDKGLYAFANMEKDEESKKLAHTIFGERLPSKDVAAFWVGNAVVNQLGFSSIADAYIANDIPIPAEAQNFEQLATTLGQNILDKFSKSYDDQKAIADAKAKKLADFHQNLFSGKLKPQDLTLEETQDFIFAYKYNPQDVVDAGRLYEAEVKRSTGKMVGAPLATTLFAAGAAIARLGEAGIYASHGDFRQAAKRLWRSSTKVESLLDESIKATADAWADEDVVNANILANAHNPTKAIQIATSYAYDAAKKEAESSIMPMRVFQHALDSAGDYARSATSLAFTPAARALGVAEAPSADIRQGFRATSAISAAKDTAGQEVAESRDWFFGTLESASKGLIDLIPYANFSTAMPAMRDLFVENAGRGYSEIANEDGSIPEGFNSEVELYAGASAYINYVTRIFGGKVVPKWVNKGLTKIGVNSTIGHYIGSAGWTAIGFATIVPSVDAGLRLLYEKAVNLNPKLRTGYADLEKLWTQDIVNSRYLLTQATIGAVLGIKGTRDYHRASLELAEMAEIKGLSRDEASAIRRSTPLQDLPAAFRDAIATKLRENPQQAIKDALANTRRIASQEEQRAAEELGRRITVDNARQAALRFMGISVAEGKSKDSYAITVDGKIDPETGQFIEGNKTIEVKKADAELYLGSIFSHKAANRAAHIRNAFANGFFIDAARKNLEGQIDIVSILDPDNFNNIIQHGKEAEALIESRTKELVKQSEGEDGKPTLSVADARAQASKEVHKDLHESFSLAELVQFGKEAGKRLQQETKRNRSLVKKSFMSFVNVITKGRRDNNSLQRIFRIAYGASTRDMVEDYGEQWMSDYMHRNNIDVTDAWRLLSDVAELVKDNRFSLTTLQDTMPALAERLQQQDKSTSENFSLEELREIQRDVTEGFSKLLVSELRFRAMNNDISVPQWAKELFASAELVDLTMEQEMAYAAAMHEAISIGSQNETAKRLLDASPDEVTGILNAIETPTVNKYLESYHNMRQRYEALIKNADARTLDEMEARLDQHIKDSEALQKQIKDEDDERNADIIQQIKDAESLPENAGKSHDEIVREVNMRFIEEQEKSVGENITAEDSSISANGKTYETSDKSYLGCKFAVVNVADLSLMPNFKTGADKETGEVSPLSGDYHADHDPIRVLQRKDGSLMVFSGRHRLAHAKRFGLTKIAAYIYQESDTQNLSWCRLKDIEWNIKDDQASSYDVALLIRGDLIEGIPPLNDQQIETFGILRRGSKSLVGYEIATNATDDTYAAYKNGDITDAQAQALAQFSDPTVQNRGLKLAIDKGLGSRALLSHMLITQDQVSVLREKRGLSQLDLFNVEELDTPYSIFVNEYTQDKLSLLRQAKNIEKLKRALKSDAALAVFAKDMGFSLSFLKSLRAEKGKNDFSIERLIDIYSHPWSNKDIIGADIDAAFAEKYPEEWAKMQKEAESFSDALPDSVDSDSPSEDSSTDSLFADFSVIGENAQTWQNYASRAFRGRDDNKLRAEIDTSQAKIRKRPFGGTHKLSEILDFPELYEAYPDLKDVTVSFRNLGFRVMGTAYVDFDQIEMNYFTLFNKKWMKSILLHEVQHIIHGYEGWVTARAETLPSLVKRHSRAYRADSVMALHNLAQKADDILNQITHKLQQERAITDDIVSLMESYNQTADAFNNGQTESFVDIGLLYRSSFDIDTKSSVSIFRDVTLENLKESMAKIKEKLDPMAKEAIKFSQSADYQREKETLQKYLLQDEYDIYLRDPDEIEARAVQSRINLTAEQRLETPFNESLEYPINNTTVLSQFGINPISTDSDSPTSSLTADFSVQAYDSLQSWQLDPTAGLGSLGHFAETITHKLTATGDDVTDKKFSQMQNFLRRRINEIQSLHAPVDADMLLAEMANIPNIVSQLPDRYRFGLEPYINFLTTYANLIKHADPDTAGVALPMKSWPERMAHSFRAAFDRILSDDMDAQERQEFFNLFDSDKARKDIQKLYNTIEEAIAKHRDEFVQQHPKADLSDKENINKQYEQERAAIIDETLAKNTEIAQNIYRAIGQMRAHRLINKLFTRIALKIDHYRKDRILGKIIRALSAVTPRKSKNGKPTKGTIPLETYKTLLTNYRLLRLTKNQKETFEENNTDLVNQDNPEAVFNIPAYDEQGQEITITCTKQQYEAYASLDAMTADQASDTQKLLGTLIATGREAWKLQAEAAKAEVDNFCASIYERYTEDPNQRGIRNRDEKNRIRGNSKILDVCTRFLAGAYNDSQLMDVIAASPGLQQFKQVQHGIANAHAYMEASEKQTILNLTKDVLAVCGYPNADPTKVTAEQRQALSQFIEKINERVQLSGDDAIIMTPQPPDFLTQQQESLGHSLENRIFQYTRSKNYNPNKLAAVFARLRGTMPTKIYNRISARFISGDPLQYKHDIIQAIEDVIPNTRFGHLRNINQTAKERAEQARNTWEIENKDNTGYTITELTRSEAAYRVLMTEQPDLADSLRRNGYTPEVIAKLRQFAGADMMQLAYTLRDRLNARLPILKKIYETTYGTPFPAVENYFRAFFDVGNKESNDAQLEGLAFGQSDKKNGGMQLFSTRVKHNHDIQPDMDVIHAFQLGMKQQDNIIGYSNPNTHIHLGDFMRRVLANKKGKVEMQHVLENAIGKPVVGALAAQTENMFRIYGHSEAYNAAANRAMQNINAASAFVLLAARITSITKNIPALFNTLGGSDHVNPHQWFASFARNIMPFMRTKAKQHNFDISQEDFIQARFKGWDTDAYAETILSHAGIKPSLNAISKVAHRAMSIFGAFDRLLTTHSAETMYDAAYRSIAKKNTELTHDQIHELALQEVRTALSVKGQPASFTQRPLISTRNSMLTAGYYFLGGEAWNTFGDVSRLISKAIFNSKAPRKERLNALYNLAAVWFTNGAILAGLNIAFQFLLDDEEHWKKRNVWASLGWGTLLGPVNGIPILSNMGAAVSEWANRKLGWGNYYISTPSFIPMNNLIAETDRTINIIFNDKKGKYSAYDKAIAGENLFRTLFLFGILSTLRPTTKAGAAIRTTSLIGAAAANATDFFLRLGRATSERY